MFDKAVYSKKYAPKWRAKNREKWNAYQREYYRTHKSKYTAYGRKCFLRHQEDRRRWKEGIINHYSNGTMKCARCGFDNIKALSIDHVAGDGAKHRKKVRGHFYIWLKKNKYPAGLQVLCMNCQFIKKYDNKEYKGHGSNDI